MERRRGGAALALCLSLGLLPGCVHNFVLHARDGQKLSGKYRFARDDAGLVQIAAPGGEVLNGKFVEVERASFVVAYQKAFGPGSIAAYGPDISGYGNLFAGGFGNSSALSDTAYGESFDRERAGKEMKVTGPLFYWTSSLLGNKGTIMGCYFIGSTYTGHGFGRCKSGAGNEYSLEF